MLQSFHHILIMDHPDPDPDPDPDQNADEDENRQPENIENERNHQRRQQPINNNDMEDLQNDVDAAAKAAAENRERLHTEQWRILEKIDKENPTFTRKKDPQLPLIENILKNNRAELIITPATQRADRLLRKRGMFYSATVLFI